MNDTEKRTRHGPALTRRQFLKGSSAVAATTLGAGTVPESAQAQQAPAGMGPAAVPLQLAVDGKKVTANVEPRTTLLDVLRDFMDVTGCKRVCDRGSCGACTVLLDGAPVYSCSMLALEARGKEIKTAASLGADGKLDAVPAAFVRYDAQQCGFCTPGFVVAMKAVFTKNPKATPQEVEEGLAGNICRCGTYEQMRHAIAALCKGGK
jgi:xanthine dehydrogenase YagT iron-sulfur-binding subunit